MLSKKDNGRGTATLFTLVNEKPIFLENISTKDDAWEEMFFKKDNGRGTHQAHFFS